MWDNGILYISLQNTSHFHDGSTKYDPPFKIIFTLALNNLLIMFNIISFNSLLYMLISQNYTGI